VTTVITLGWVLALIVLLGIRGALPADVRWWVWTCVTGIVMGLFGLWYVPFLKRKRTRIAAERARLAGTPGVPEVPETSETETQLSSGYVSRESGSNTVSSTETPGKSTRS